MFPANNIWNTDISLLPRAANSAAWLSKMNAGSAHLHPDFGPNPGGYPYGIPYNVVTNAHQKVSVSFQYSDESDRWKYPFGPDISIEGGSGSGGDQHAIMVNSDTCTLYELYDANYAAGGRSTAGSGAIWRLNSNALRPVTWTSADAAGLPILPGLLNYAQVQQAVQSGQPIRHAIRFTADNIRAAYYWPARHLTGSDNSSSLPPMGARFRLMGGINVASFCKLSTAYCSDFRAILTEMQHYGMILADNGSNWFFQGTSAPAWPDALIEMLKTIPARDFVAVNERCLMVNQNSGLAEPHPGWSNCRIG